MEITQQSDICSRCIIICCDSQLCLQFIVCWRQHCATHARCVSWRGRSCPFPPDSCVRFCCECWWIVAPWQLLPSRCTQTARGWSQSDVAGSGPVTPHHHFDELWVSQRGPLQYSGARMHHAHHGTRRPIPAARTSALAAAWSLPDWLDGWMVAGTTVLPWPAATW